MVERKKRKGMTKKAYYTDRLLHWVSAFLLLFMLLNLSSQLHNVDWAIKGQLEHRQDAVEMHAFVGITLILFIFARLIFPLVVKSHVKRIEPKTRLHAGFIKVTHLALYVCIILLVTTGIVMVKNYEIPLTIIGIDISPDKNAFYSVFPKFYEIHMVLQEVIWWLIAIHFAGVMYAKR